MTGRTKIIALVIVLGAGGLLAAGEGYFYFVVLKPGVRAMIQAAERGDAETQFELGVLYERPGKFAPAILPDAAKSVFWFKKAAEQGHADAEVFLALAYAGGKGIRQDDAEAVRWMHRAAEQGSADGQMILGRIFDNGYNGVVRDHVQAVQWYRMAAERGHAAAQKLLGDAYASGRGVERDELQAVGWYKKAADQGDPEAQRHLRDMRPRGRGVAP